MVDVYVHVIQVHHDTALTIGLFPNLQEVQMQMYSVFNVPIGSSRRTRLDDEQTDGWMDTAT